MPARLTATTPPPLPAQRGSLVADLSQALRGQLALPGSEAYDRLRASFNLAVDVRPLAVVAALDAYDVATAVRVAGRHGVPVGVQATGHGAEHRMEGALLVSTALLDECVVHPEGWARVGAGVPWRTVLDAAAPHGLTGLAGSSSGVGVVGYTTGGGLGPMSRTYGLASDRVRAFDVVTGQGRLVRATADEHADLFWALRGGRGRLGIVTAVEFDLVPLERVHGGAVHFDGAAAPRVLQAWRTWSQTLPPTATTSVALRRLPALPGVPPPLAGRLTVAVRFVSTGDAAQAQALLAPLREVAAPVLDSIGELPATALDAVHQDPPTPMPSYLAAGLLRELPAESVDALLAVAGAGQDTPLAVVELRQLGGAVAAPGPAVAPSAVCHRDAAYVLTCIGLAAPAVVDAVTASASAVLAAMGPWSTGAALPNFNGGLGAYDEASLARLRMLVDLHDPERVLLAARDL